jgi:uncharacterized phage-associated protein
MNIGRRKRENKMAITAAETAKEILYAGKLRGCKDITNLKLQKLLYFANLVHISVFGIPLFLENIKAWKLGPVVGTVYYDYKQYGYSPIPDVTQKTANKILEQVIGFVTDIFGYKTAPELVDITHLDPVYEAAREGSDKIMRHSRADAVMVISSQMKTIVERAEYASLVGRINPCKAAKGFTYVDDYKGVSEKERREIWGLPDQ